MSKFEQALNVDTKPLLRKKGANSYLPWASAWSEFKKIHTNGNFKFIKNQFGGYVFEERINQKQIIKEDGAVDYDEGICIGYFVLVEITDGEEIPLMHELSLPIMDFKNKANMNFTVMEVNKALLRCLTKGVSLFGTGLPNYAGEEYYQYEIGAEFDAIKEEILEIAKEIMAIDDAKRSEAINIIGNKGHTAKIKDTEEANEKKERLLKLLEEVKKTATKSNKTTKKEGEK